MNLPVKSDFKSGDYIVISEGVYADYDLQKVVSVLRDFNIHEQAKLFASSGLVEYSFCNNEGKEFYTFLVEKGLVVPIEYTEVWVGAYDFRLHEDD